MKKSLLGLVAVGALIAGPAMAADLRMPVKAPPAPIEPACAWCGWYVGVNVGGAWDADTATAFSGNPATAIFFTANEFPTSLAPKADGVIGGGQIGYNWMAGSNLLVGLEADIQGSGYKGSASVISTPTGALVPFATTVEQHSDWFGTFRGRLGFVATPNLLLYGTGGLAYGQTEVSFNTVPTGFACGPGFTCAAGSTTSTRVGWTAGAGLEWMIMPRLSLKAEYLYMDLGSQSVTAVSTAAGGPFTFTATAPFRENIVRAGLNWHFGGDAIATRY
jgi:outer membrane immunogenic protein